MPSQLLDLNVWDLEDGDASARRFLEGSFFRHLRHGDRVLDLGCGTGIVAAALRARGFRILGVDVNEEAVSKAQERGVAVTSCDAAEAVRRHGGDYNVFLMLDLIEHLSMASAIELLERIGERPGARLLLSTPNLESLMGFKFWFHVPTHVTPLHPFVLRRLLAKLGFRTVAEWTEYGNLPGRGWKLWCRRRLLYALLGTQADLFMGGANLCLVAESGPGAGPGNPS